MFELVEVSRAILCKSCIYELYPDQLELPLMANHENLSIQQRKDTFNHGRRVDDTAQTANEIVHLGTPLVVRLGYLQSSFSGKNEPIKYLSQENALLCSELGYALTLPRLYAHLRSCSWTKRTRDPTRC